MKAGIVALYATKVTFIAFVSVRAGGAVSGGRGLRGR
jgi:hypothetical protein